MWIKLLGICLVCVSCAGIGGGEALCLIGRRRFLEEVKRIAAGLRGEIGYTQAVLPLVLCRAGARGDGKAGKLFLVAGERLEANPECPFGRIWEAVLEEQGEGALKEPECTADLDVTANISKSYVSSGEQRMDLYRRMAAIRTQEDADDLLDEIVDRYGDPPKGVMNLIAIALLRARAASSGIVELSQKGQTLTVTTHLLHPYIYADVPHLTEVCTNLVSNAVKYTGNGGMICCDVTQKPGEKEGWCDTVVTVADNGIGMSQEFQKHIFEPFERERTSTVSKVEGSGIGMGIVKKLVGLMGGTVEVESRIGVGSTFTVTIPCRIASEDETQAKRETNPSDQKCLCGTRILLTEDNDLNAEIAVELLQEEGCTVDRAKDGVECVDMLEKAANGTYQLILMDIQMPVMNGYDAARKIRGLDDPQKANIPIIAMTANAFTEDRQVALDAGMNDHIAKPINMNVLVPTLRKYL